MIFMKDLNGSYSPFRSNLIYGGFCYDYRKGYVKVISAV